MFRNLEIPLKLKTDEMHSNHFDSHEWTKTEFEQKRPLENE